MINQVQTQVIKQTRIHLIKIHQRRTISDQPYATTNMSQPAQPVSSANADQASSQPAHETNSNGNTNDKTNEPSNQSDVNQQYPPADESLQDAIKTRLSSIKNIQLIIDDQLIFK